MLETKQQKQIFAGSLVLVLILSMISFWNKPAYHYQDNTDYSQYEIDPEKYQKYLASLNLDIEASQDVFEQIITEDDIRREVENDLQVNQAIEPPEIDPASIKMSAASGEEAVIAYLKDSVTAAWVLDSRAQLAAAGLFTKNADSDEDLAIEVNKQIIRIKDLQVPKDAVSLHKNLLTSLMAYNELAATSHTYALGANSNPWPNVYKEYSIINDSLRAYNQDLLKIADKYKIASLEINLHFAESEQPDGFSLVPTAHAFLPGIPSASFTIGDIPRIVRDALQDGLEASFTQFMSSFLQKLIMKIENNYLISNFLYYSDALISGQYSGDYLVKYVTEDLDRKIIKNMLPQLSCGQPNEDVQKAFQAKADQYLGFDPRSLDPKDGQFNQKLARMGDFLAQPDGWKLHFQDLAAKTQSEAEKAAMRELTSTGLKTPRDVSSKSLSVSISAIVSTQRASLNNIMNTGINASKNFVSAFVSNIMQTLMNQYIFRGATSVRGGNAAGVLKEQSTCLAAAQMQALVPLETTNYVPPSSTKTEDQILNETCLKYPEACRNPNNGTGNDFGN